MSGRSSQLYMKSRNLHVQLYAVAERKPEKIQACQDLNPDLCDTN